MTISIKMLASGFAAFSALAFASSAHAGNGFNKYPTKASAVHTLKASPHVLTGVQKANVVTTKRRIKRVVQPVPSTLTNRVSFATNHGAKNKRSGFNKMTTSDSKTTVIMPTFVDKGALTAR